MPTRVFSEDDIRDIVMSIEHAVVATRGGIVVAVNDAWVLLHGHTRASVEGKPLDNLIADQERERLVKRALLPDDQVSFEKPLRTIVRRSDGTLVPVRVFTSRFHAQAPPDYRLTIVLPESGGDVDPAFARELLALSAELIGAGSDAEVRERTCAAFARAGLSARFWRAGTAGDAAVDVASAKRALAERTTIFEGAQTSPDAVYVPLAEDEILLVTGPGLTGQHAYVFGFFAKLVSTALLDVHASAAAQRTLSDTQLVLQLARTTSETLDLDVVLGLTADSLVQLLDVASCFILLYDEHASVLRGGASSHRRRDVIKDITIPLDDPDSLSARAARDRRVIVIADTSRDSDAKRAPLVTAFEETALAALPILSRGRLEGVVVLDETRGPRTYTKEWIELATAMVAQVGLSIANARLYESLRHSYDELAATRAEMVKRERLAGLGELAAIVAHEVRNPLGVIYNATNSLTRLLDGSADGATLVDIVREECDRLNQIVGDLLDFARPRQLSLQPEEIGRVLSEVVEALGSMPNMRFEVTVDDELPVLVADRRLIRQALLNAALNAVQSMPRGGTLRLRATWDRENDEAVIEVADEGPGIPEADLLRIFEPFYTTKATGAGLGLAVVKRIVEDHGGRISVTSASTGTTFCFRLPLSPQRK